MNRDSLAGKIKSYWDGVFSLTREEQRRKSLGAWYKLMEQSRNRDLEARLEKASKVGKVNIDFPYRVEYTCYCLPEKNFNNFNEDTPNDEDNLLDGEGIDEGME